MILYILFLVWVLFFNLIYVAGSFVNSKRSHWMCSIKKAVLKNFAIVTGKLVFGKQTFRPATSLKRDFNRGVFL